MMAGRLASGARSAQRVFTGLAGALDTAQRSHDQAAGRPGRAPTGLERAGGAAPPVVLETRISSALTVHSPGRSPNTHVLIEMGPVPGETRSIVSSWTKLSRG